MAGNVVCSIVDVWGGEELVSRDDDCRSMLVDSGIADVVSAFVEISAKAVDVASMDVACNVLVMDSVNVSLSIVPYAHVDVTVPIQEKQSSHTSRSKHCYNNSE